MADLTMIIHNGDGSIREEIAVISKAKAHAAAAKKSIPPNGFVRVIATKELARKRAEHPTWPRNQVPPNTGGDFIGRTDARGAYQRNG